MLQFLCFLNVEFIYKICYHNIMMKNNIEINKIELLSPAGNAESFKAACIGGADAIYMGLDKFNARTMAENFDIEKYIDCIEYAHFRGIKVYLTLNTLMNDSEIDEALELLIKLYSKGLDAVILQDIGLANIIHQVLPDLHIHASTQMSVYSLEQVKFLETLGFKRVVLARELLINEIKYICDNTNVEIEVFVHGALCVSLSGQCLLSSIIGSRSANKGACAQPCRMRYSLCDLKDKEVISNKYLLSKKDIYGLEYVNKLKSIGVASLKIEGRNKTPEYVLGVTKTYRKYIDNDNKVVESDKYILKQLFNRDGLSDGYLNGVKYKESISILSPKNTGIYLGKVISTYKKYIKIKLEQDISLHDGIEIYSNDRVVSSIVTCIKDDKGNIINSKIGKGEYVFLGDFKERIERGSKVYKTSSDELNKSLKDEYTTSNKRKDYNIEIDILQNKNITAKIKELNLNIAYDYIPQDAKTKALEVDDIIKAFNKTLDEPFNFINVNVNLDKKLFVPTSVLNDIRRTVVEKIKESMRIRLDLSGINEKIKVVKEKLYKEAINNKSSDKQNTFFIYKYDKNIDYIKEYKEKYEKKIDIVYINFADFYKNKDDILLKYKEKIDIYLNIPNYVGKNLDKIIKENIEEYINMGINGFLIGSFACYDLLIKLKKKYSFKLVADYSFNITNIYSACLLKRLGLDKITPSVELSSPEYLNISKYVCSEAVTDLITVMTSRYCILGSFIGEKTDSNNCKHPCKSNYYLKDLHRS